MSDFSKMTTEELEAAIKAERASSAKRNPITDAGKSAAKGVGKLAGRAAQAYENYGAGPLRLALDAILPGMPSGEKNGKFPSGEEILKSRGVSGPRGTGRGFSDFAKTGGAVIDFLADPGLLAAGTLKGVGYLGRKASAGLGILDDATRLAPDAKVRYSAQEMGDSGMYGIRDNLDKFDGEDARVFFGEPGKMLKPQIESLNKKDVTAIGRRMVKIGEAIKNGVSKTAATPNKMVEEAAKGIRDYAGSSAGAAINSAIGGDPLVGAALGTTVNRPLRKVLRGAPTKAANAINNTPEDVLAGISAYFSGQRTKDRQ